MPSARRAPLAVRLVLCLLLVLPASPGLAEEAAARPRIGLVLSGGGARGGAHIGVLKVLEELHVPIDVIVGTSAGSIVGAAYASGLPLASIEEEMKGLSTAVLFRDLERDDVPYRLKSDDANNYVGPEIGVRKDGLLLPKGAVAGVSLEAVLRRLTRRQSTTDFDQLPIAFRAIATDLTTGDMVVLSQGSLATAIRASMAIPGAVNPVETDDRLLVDGGLTRNLPIDIARQLGVDVIIAVNVGTPLLKREQITSLLAVSEQMLAILTEANVKQSLTELRSGDVLITPSLENITSAGFDRLSEAAQAGEQAARSMEPQLARYSIDEQAYRQLTTARFQGTRPPSTSIEEVRITGTDKVNPETVLEAMDSRPGKEFDAKTIDADLKRIYGRGDFESVSYSLIEEPGKGSVLAVDVAEKSWGPNYLRFGLALSSDFKGNSFFNLLASHRWTWLNPLGAEWRNDLQIGRNDRLRTEWYQPLTERQKFFVAPYLQFTRDPFDIFDDEGDRLARFRIATYGGGIDLGSPIGTVGEVRLGLYRGHVKGLQDTLTLPGNADLPNVSAGGVKLHVGIDSMDNLRFPREGYVADLLVYSSMPWLGADDEYTKAAFSGGGAWAVGPHSLQVGVRAGGRVGEHPLPEYEVFTLGGFLQLSGYQTQQFAGAEMAFGRLIYNYRLAGPGLLDGVYVGGSLEAGRIGNVVFGANAGRTRYGSSLYFALDTPIGPVYLAYGHGEGDNQAFYFFLGRP